MHEQQVSLGAFLNDCLAASVLINRSNCGQFVERVVVEEATITEGKAPLLVYREAAKQA